MRQPGLASRLIYGRAAANQMLFHDSQRSDELANACRPVPDRLKPTRFSLEHQKAAIP